MRTTPVNLLTTFCFFILAISCQPTKDPKIEDSIKSGVNILDSSIQVSVEDGVVTLSGAVKDSTTKNAAESAVKEMKGVKSIINKMTVK